MRKIFALVIISTMLTGCTNLFSSFLGGGSTPKEGDTVMVNYVGTEDDGTEFDSSLRPGREPLKFVIGQGSMIAGFEEAVKTMKVGEKKKVRLEAKDAYGEEYKTETISLEEFKDVVTQVVPADALLGNLTQNIKLDQAKNIFGSLDIGSEKKIGEANLKIVAVNGDEVNVAIKDPKAPFFGKKVEVGQMATGIDGSEVTIKKVEGKDVTIDIKPKREVVSQTDKDVTVRTKNTHPLAGKPLNFEIELLSINQTDDSKTDTITK